LKKTEEENIFGINTRLYFRQTSPVTPNALTPDIKLIKLKCDRVISSLKPFPLVYKIFVGGIIANQ
jgi:hypothetical protein